MKSACCLSTPAHQRSGIGSRLLQHLEELVPAGMFRDIFVYAAPEATAFYRARGYRPGGAHTIASGTFIIQTVYMTKPLGPSPY
jgi:GNAT superfamily N-acetyltransferase